MNIKIYSNIKLDNTSNVFNDALNVIKDRVNDVNYSIFDLETANDYDRSFDELELIASRIKNNFEAVVIIGMGGAILNSKIFKKFNQSDKLKILFLDTLDISKFYEVKNSVEIKNSAFIFISKSGESIETILLYKTWSKIFINEQVYKFQDHFFVITLPIKSILYNMAITDGVEVLIHSKISGRFCTFTNITLLPMLLMSLNPQDFCQGRKLILNDLYVNKEHSLAAKFISFMMNANQFNRVISVNISYIHKLQNFQKWYNQIVSESLGKSGFGITPLSTYGPEDQHTQLQLYLDGPKDKFFTIFALEADVDNNLPTVEINNAFTNIDNVFKVQSENLYNTFVLAKEPVRVIKLSDISVSTLGQLSMLSMIEIVLFGVIKKIDPFNQPAVETIKNDIYKYI